MASQAAVEAVLEAVAEALVNKRGANSPFTHYMDRNFSGSGEEIK